MLKLNNSPVKICPTPHPHPTHTHTQTPSKVHLIKDMIYHIFSPPQSGRQAPVEILPEIPKELNIRKYKCLWLLQVTISTWWVESKCTTRSSFTPEFLSKYSKTREPMGSKGDRPTPPPWLLHVYPLLLLLYGGGVGGGSSFFNTESCHSDIYFGNTMFDGTQFYIL